MENGKQPYIVVPVDSEFKKYIENEAKRRRLSVAALVRTKMSFCIPKYQKTDIKEQKTEPMERK